ncbi:MAG: DUF368 domain-containing protein [Clostridiaceae bacterium]|nr:DUF368 domain-containing protein [Clostridiaceae bacterium]
MLDKENTPDKINHPLADWFIRLLKGFIIGFGAIVPGLSGGVLSVILGVYDRMMSFLGNIRKDFLKNVRYFFPIGIGGVLGIIFFAGIIEAAFGTYAALFTALFIGFVAGTFPSVYRTAGKQGRTGSDKLTMLIAAAFVFALMLLGEQNFTQVEPNIIVWILSGAVVALGFIVPGLSPSNFLIYFGLYDKMASGIKNFDFMMLIPFIIGAVVSIMLFAKLVNFLFAKYYRKMYHIILGLIVGSTLGIFPTVIFPAFTTENLDVMKMSFIVAITVSIVMFFIGIVISYFFGKLEEKYSPED